MYPQDGINLSHCAINNNSGPGINSPASHQNLPLPRPHRPRPAPDRRLTAESRAGHGRWAESSWAEPNVVGQRLAPSVVGQRSYHFALLCLVGTLSRNQRLCGMHVHNVPTTFQVMHHLRALVELYQCTNFRVAPSKFPEVKKRCILPMYVQCA